MGNSDQDSNIDLDLSYLNETRKIKKMIEGKEENDEKEHVSPFIRKKILNLNNIEQHS